MGRPVGSLPLLVSVRVQPLSQFKERQSIDNKKQRNREPLCHSHLQSTDILEMARSDRLGAPSTAKLRNTSAAIPTAFILNRARASSAKITWTNIFEDCISKFLCKDYVQSRQLHRALAIQRPRMTPQRLLYNPR